MKYRPFQIDFGSAHPYVQAEIEETDSVVRQAQDVAGVWVGAELAAGVDAGAVEAEDRLADVVAHRLVDVGEVMKLRAVQELGHHDAVGAQLVDRLGDREHRMCAMSFEDRAVVGQLPAVVEFGRDLSADLGHHRIQSSDRVGPGA